MCVSGVCVCVCGELCVCEVYVCVCVVCVYEWCVCGELCVCEVCGVCVDPPLPARPGALPAGLHVAVCVCVWCVCV